MSKFVTRLGTIAGAVALLSACSMAPSYERPSFDIGDVWSSAGTAEKTRDITPDYHQQELANWWQSYNDPALTALVEEGLQHNDDLALAAARVAQARAQVDFAGANRFPELDVDGSAARVREPYGVSNPTYPTKTTGNSFGVSGVLSYEVDLWGKLKSADHVAQAQLLSTAYNADNVRLAVASEIAQGYFNLKALDAEIAVTENTISARQDAFDFENAQYKHGATDGLTLRQSESEVAAARAQLPQLQQSREEQATALAVLLGRTPKDILTGDVAAVADSGTDKDKNAEAMIDALPVPPVVPAELPSTLLERRPDIAAAEQSLIAANANIGVARAAYFPTISLSALLGVSSVEMNHLFDSTSRTWQLGGALAGPVIDFGRTSANVDQAHGMYDAALASYQQGVRTAFKDVRDALTATDTTARQQDADAAQVQAESETLRLANLRYTSGYSNHLEVLDAQRGLYTAQIDRIDAKRARLVASLNLYKALGGGWKAPAAE